MSVNEYLKITLNPDICNSQSFRGILANRYNFDTINFSAQGSSNQKQFRLLKNFLSSEFGKNMLNNYSTVVVLHGITSTARNEIYLTNFNSLINFKYDNPEYKKWSKIIVKHFYNHDNEVARLAEEINFLNQYYQSTGIKNIWFDTFNHHSYPVRIENLIGVDSVARDLLSRMAMLNGLTKFDNNYHQSSSIVDSNRVQFLIDNDYLNPFSMHPTKKAHQSIADIITPHLKKLI